MPTCSPSWNKKATVLPAGRTFVQPNIIDLQDLNVEEKRPRYRYGDRVRTEELVFFGRLEARKGLDIFCEAVTRIIELGIEPRKITFLGKQGERLPAHPEVTSIEFIHRQAQTWPFPVEIIDSYDQDKAIGYLCASPRIAVMPSVIENSTMTVYECLVHKIPFLATAVGGTRELINARYHDRVLTDAHPEALADALQEVLREGGTVAEGAFDYKENLNVWRDFHRYLAAALVTKPASEVVADVGDRYRDEEGSTPRQTEGGGSGPAAPVQTAGPNDSRAELRVSVCIYHHRQPQFLEALLESLLLQDCEIDEVVIMNDGPQSEDAPGVLRHIEERFASLGWKILEQPHRCIGPALNAAASQTSGDLLVFLNAEHHYCEPNLIGVLRRAAAASPAAAFTCFHAFFEDQRPGQDDNDVRVAPLGGDLATGFYEDGVFGGSCFAVRRAVFHGMGGFYEGYHLGGIEQEFHARLAIAGYDLDVVPEVLYWERCVASITPFDRKSKEYLAIHPYLRSAPYYLENIMLTARMLARKVERAEARNHHHRAELAMRRRDWEAACALWAEMRQDFPDNAAGFVRGAAALIHAGRLAEADTVAGKAVKRFPDHAGGHIQRPELAMRRRDWEAACALWAEMRQDFPDNAAGFVRGAAALIHAGRLAEADTVAGKAVKRFPDHAGGHIQRAELAMRRRDWEAACALWAEMRRDFPDNAAGFVRGAAALIHAGRLAEAEQARRLAPDLRGLPDEERAYVAYAATYVRNAAGPGVPRPYRGGHVMALERRRSRFGIDRLEVSAVLDSGWIARARERHGHEAACELRRNGRVAARTRLDHVSGNVLRVATGLRIPIIGDVLCSIHDAFSGETLAALITPTLQRAQRVTGSVENRQQPEVRGWVLNPGNPGHSRRVAIHVDGCLREIVNAEKQRADIARWKGTEGYHGFLWRIPEVLATQDGARIEVFDADTGRPLRGSPVRVEDGQVIVSG